jgi:hypothetical protein
MLFFGLFLSLKYIYLLFILIFSGFAIMYVFLVLFAYLVSVTMYACSFCVFLDGELDG